MKTILGDSVDNAIYVHGIYEEPTSRLIQALSPACRSFIDVGCNIGYYSCLFAVSNPTGSVYCIDPNPEMISRTRENLNLNCVENGRLLPIAAGSEICTMTLNIPADRHSLSSLAYVPKRSEGVDNRGIEVPVKPLTDIIEENQITEALLKIDAEGFEYQVFCGLTDAVVDAVKYLIFELSTKNLERAGTAVGDLFLFEWMKQFSFFRIVDGKNAVIKETPQTLIENNTSANILMVRSGQSLPSSLG